MTAFSEHLARLALESELTASAQHAAVRAIVDWAACGLGGSHHDATDAVVAASRVFGVGADATFIGRVERGSPYSAAMVNGVASHVLDYDDVNVAMIGHPAVVVISAAIAVTEASGARGSDLLSAITAGYEVAAAVGRAINPTHYERGWHATGTIGTVAAAAACSRLFTTNVAKTEQILSTAASSASGVRSVFGTHGKALNAGRAAASGLLASRLVEEGLDSPANAFVGPGGWMTAMDDEREFEAPTRGSRLAIEETAFKSHASCGATHCLIDAIGGIVEDFDVAPGAIHDITVRVHPLALIAAAIEEPRSALEAKFSLAHTAAMAVFNHPLGHDKFTNELVLRPEVIAMRRRVTIIAESTFAYVQAMPSRVCIRLTDGRELDRFVDTPRGRPLNPLSDAELSEKFASLGEAVLSRAGVEAALESLWSLPECEDVSTVMKRLRP